MISAALAGFGLGLGLIVAIGAQNALVLRQGLLKQHVLPVVVLCSLSDAFLIVLGVAGVGTLVSSNAGLLRVVTIGGAVFLSVYGAMAIWRAVKPDVLDSRRGGRGDLRTVMATCLALTFLNPHVYLDTVVLLGGLSAQFEGNRRVAYGAGAALASAVWFVALGFGARLLGPLFRKPNAWRVLDLIIATVMFTLAFQLVREFILA